jgi:carbamoyltransferase
LLRLFAPDHLDEPFAAAPGLNAMALLGLSFDYHNAAAALVADGVVVSAIEEERLSRTKHDGRYPYRAIRHVLATAGVRARDLERVVYYENPFRKFERIARGSMWRPRSQLAATLKNWLELGKFEPVQRIAEDLGLDHDRIVLCRHHLAHAAAAFYCSPFEQATVVVLDGVGESETGSVWIGRDRDLTQIGRLDFPHSIGLLYSAFTGFLGFEVHDGEWKVMGMSAYGRPTRREDVLKLIRRQAPLRLSERYFNFFAPRGAFYTKAFTDIFGPPRQPGAAFDLDQEAMSREDAHYADIAASIQVVTEELIQSFVRRAVARTGVKNVAFAGGVALNVLANARLQAEPGLQLYIHPAAGDAGSAVGAALWAHCALQSKPRPPPLTACYLGGAYGDAAIQAALTAGGFNAWRRFATQPEMIEAATDLLADGKVIGWFQGRSEWGPRGLGARSILCRPYPAAMRDTVNRTVKFREPFRPFAPAVLAERAHEFFETPPAAAQWQPESFMLAIARVRTEQRHRIPAVTHVDGTGRLQLVWPDPNPPFRALLERFGARTGIPVLLNTSLNLRGEPIVETPHDALRTFSWSGLDALVIGSFIVDKTDIA